MKGSIWKKFAGCLACVLALALCLSLNFGKAKNASALADAFVPTIDRNITSITYNKKMNNVTTNNVVKTTVNTNYFRFAEGPASNYTDTQTQYIDLRKVTLNRNVAWNTDVKYKWSALITLKINGTNSDATVNCPAADTSTTRNIILDCKITALGVTQAQDFQYGQAGQQWSGVKEYIYQMEVYGTYDISDLDLPYSTNYIDFGGTWIQYNGSTDGLNVIEIIIANSRFATGYEYNEALEIAEQQRQQDQEDRNNVSSASDQAEGDGDSATSDAQGQTQSALSVVTGFVSAITNMHQTNCKIPNITINGMVLENLDFCQTPVPPQLMALVGLGMVFIIVPLAISLVKRMLSLYNEILGGK